MSEPIKPSSQVSSGCACRSHDLFECWDLRRSPGIPPKDDGPCYCECHDHHDFDLNEFDESDVE